MLSQLRTNFAPVIGVPILALLLNTACTTTVPNPLSQPDDDIKATLVLQDERFKSLFDQLEKMEKALEGYSADAKDPYMLDGELIYTFDNYTLKKVLDLQETLNKTHQEIFRFVLNPLLNPNNRLSDMSMELSGSIGDAERSLTNMRTQGDPNPPGVWRVNGSTLEDIRRVHHESQIYRAALVNSAGVKLNRSTPMVEKQ